MQNTSGSNSDPHGVQQLLALLRRQQDGQQVAQPGHRGAETSSLGKAEEKEDLRYMTFAQALPHLTKLSKDEKFLRSLLEMKAYQDQFEDMLAMEHQELSRVWAQEAQVRWDHLYARQQEQLQRIGVPCFYVTKDPTQLRKQQKVFDVLAGLLE